MRRHWGWLHTRDIVKGKLGVMPLKDIGWALRACSMLQRGSITLQQCQIYVRSYLLLQVHTQESLAANDS
jgi:hypothetical protein